MITRNLFKYLFGSLRSASSKPGRMTSTYVWIDMEMTGIDHEKDEILEIACILTDKELQPIHEGISYIIHQPEETLDSMNSWCKIQHAKSGLTEACRKSDICLFEAEEKVANYIKQYGQGQKYLAGNTVYMDRLFLMKYMPKVTSLLHYRIIDVSTLKLLFNDWLPEVYSKLPPKKLSHRALDDIRESIEELKYYKNFLLKLNDSNTLSKSCASS